MVYWPLGQVLHPGADTTHRQSAVKVDLNDTLYANIPFIPIILLAKCCKICLFLILAQDPRLAASIEGCSFPPFLLF